MTSIINSTVSLVTGVLSQGKALTMAGIDKVGAFAVQNPVPSLFGASIALEMIIYNLAKAIFDKIAPDMSESAKISSSHVASFLGTVGANSLMIPALGVNPTTPVVVGLVALLALVQSVVASRQIFNQGSTVTGNQPSPVDELTGNIPLDLDSALGKIKELEGQIQSLQNTIATRDLKIADLDKALKAAQNQLTTAQNKIIELTQQLAPAADLNKEIADLNKTIADSQKTIGDLTKQLNLTNENNAKLTQDNVQLQAQIANLLAKIETLTNSVSDLLTKLPLGDLGNILKPV